MKAPRRRRGVVLVYAAITFFLLIILVGLTLDTTLVNLTASELQTTADAASLAGAAQIPTDTTLVQPAALNIAATNLVLHQNAVIANSDVTIGYFNDPHNPTPGYPLGFTVGQQPYNACRVVARKTNGSPMGPLPLVFGPFLGANYSDVARTAVAVINITPSGVIVLDPFAAGAFTYTGSANFRVTNGQIYVNSTNSQAVIDSASGSVFTDALNISGSAKKTGSGSLPSNTRFNTQPVPDPYATLPDPPQPAPGTITGNVISPGYYPNGIHLAGNSTTTFLPGIYYFDDTVKFTGSGNIIANNVLFYIRNGNFDFTGSGDLTISPQTSGPWQGITLFQGRNNTAQSKITGSANLNLTGAIYIPNALLDLTGSGISFANSIVVKDLEITGSGDLPVNATPSPSSGHPYLVQ